MNDEHERDESDDRDFAEFDVCSEQIERAHRERLGAGINIGHTKEEINREAISALVEDMKIPQTVASGIVRYLRANKFMKAGIDEELVEDM